MSRGDLARSVRLLLVVKKRPVPFFVSAASLAFVLTCLCSCHEPLPVPRIDASLDGWAQPYAGVQGLKVHAFRTGAIRSVEGAVYAGGSWTTRTMMGAWAYVIEHPQHGLIVFDTGLSTRARTEPEHFVGWLGARLGLLDVPEHASLSEQMRSMNLDPREVHLVVLSHLHFDHTGDIAAFPNAKVVVAQAEKEWAEAGVRRIDFVDADALEGMQRWQTIDYENEKPLATFVASHDFFGDGSVVGVELSGHTPGDQGLLVKAPEAPLLITGDAAWTDKSWRWTARPLYAYDMSRWWEQIWRINKFAMVEPRVVVVPSHDDAVIAAIAVPSFVVHDPNGTHH